MKTVFESYDQILRIGSPSGKGDSIRHGVIEQHLRMSGEKWEVSTIRLNNPVWEALCNFFEKPNMAEVKK